MALLLTITGCQKDGRKSYGKIHIISSSHFEATTNNPYFTIADSSNTYGFGNTLVIKKLHSNAIRIKNTTNDGYSGQSVNFTIDSTLAVIQANYSNWTDTSDGSKNTFSVDRIQVKLNKNPFKDGYENMSGEFEVNATTTHYPYEFYKFPYQLKNSFFGRFKS